METVYIEINGAAGGDEGNIFAADLARMYEMWAGKNKIKTKRTSEYPIVLQCRGERAYDCFKYEGGVHRVQRVPETEKRGRVHTSTVTVNVFKEKMPTAVEVRESDCEFSACRSSGAGGQNTNKVNSKVRIVHKPSGIVVECQEERSQLQNRTKAMERLRAQLQEFANNEATLAATTNKRQQVGTGSRNEKIRTYNYHDSRVTDHRINWKSSKLKNILNGDMEELVAALANS